MPSAWWTAPPIRPTSLPVSQRSPPPVKAYRRPPSIGRAVFSASPQALSMLDLIKRSKVAMPEFNQLITFLKVKDIARSQAFYGGILGLPQTYSRPGKVTILQVAADSFIG